MLLNLWLQGLKGGEHLEYIGVGRKRTFKTGRIEQGWMVWAGFIWLSTETGGRLFRTRYCTIRLHKSPDIS